MNQAEYVKAALDYYVSLPETPNVPSWQDRRTAQNVYAQGVEFERLLGAMLIASGRRIRRDPELTPLSPIRSLAYFVAVLQHDPDLQKPLDPEYLGYVEEIVRTERPGQRWREMRGEQ